MIVQPQPSSWYKDPCFPIPGGLVGPGFPSSQVLVLGRTWVSQFFPGPRWLVVGQLLVLLSSALLYHNS